MAPASAQSGPAPAPAAAETPAFVYEANEPKRALKEGKVIRAVRVATPPTVDGRLGDEVWTLAPHAPADSCSAIPITDSR